MSFETSTETEKLDAALAKAQGKIRAAKKDRENPHFKSKYADMASVLEACREALAEQGITVTQWLLDTDPGKVSVLTRVAFEGQWMRGTFSIPVGKPDAQGYGSAVTYCKRYAISAALGIAADDDDDGEAAVGAAEHYSREVSPASDKPFVDQYLPLIAAAKTSAEMDELAVRMNADPMVKGAYRATLIAASKNRRAEIAAPCDVCGLTGGAHKPSCQHNPPEPGSDG
jgi:hypothetical protein